MLVGIWPILIMKRLYAIFADKGLAFVITTCNRIIQDVLADWTPAFMIELFCSHIFLQSFAFAGVLKKFFIHTFNCFPFQYPILTIIELFHFFFRWFRKHFNFFFNVDIRSYGRWGPLWFFIAHPIGHLFIVIEIFVLPMSAKDSFRIHFQRLPLSPISHLFHHFALEFFVHIFSAVHSKVISLIVHLLILLHHFFLHDHHLLFMHEKLLSIVPIVVITWWNLITIFIFLFLF